MLEEARPLEELGGHGDNGEVIDGWSESFCAAPWVDLRAALHVFPGSEEILSVTLKGILECHDT